jgi:chemotaxis protein methyltransferase CheR
MIASEIPAPAWRRLSELIAQTMGLDFPAQRRGDLQRGLAGAAQEFGFDDAQECVNWLLSAPVTPAQLQVLAAHLTVGETYFFRDPQTLQALASSILPELIQARRGRDQRLRIWSAACSSGEEPYSLAILLHEALPDLKEWEVTITATDIDRGALTKAAAGIYGEWSFRDAPARLKSRYFSRTAGGRYAIAPWIRRLVNFECLNLAQDIYPSLATGTDAMDIVFCRNVLMYFTPAQSGRVVARLRSSLVDGGWLAVSPSEASHALFPDFATANFPGAILYRKSATSPRQARWPIAASLGEAANYVAVTLEAPAPWAPAPIPALPAEAAPSPGAVAQLLYQQGRYAEAADTLADSSTQQAPGPQALSLRARSLANLGQLADALACCERWIAADKMDPAGHYLRAVVLLEQGDFEPARSSLQRAIYLDPDFVLAHFALGDLARRRGKPEEADKHFANALHLLRCQPPDAFLPESDGLTAGQLAQTIGSMLETQTSP